MLIDNKYTNQKNLNCLEKTNRTISLLKNFASLSNIEYFTCLKELFDIKFDDNDYMKYANFITGSKFTKNVPIQTDRIVSSSINESVKKNFGYTTEKVRLWFHVLVNDSFESTNSYYSIDQIQNLLKQNKIFPLYRCYYPCSQDCEIIAVEDDVNCLLTEENGSITDSKFIDFMVREIKKNIKFHDILLRVQQYVFQSLIELDCIDPDSLDDVELETLKQNKEGINELITVYNNIIDTYGIKMKLLSVNTIDYIIAYLSNLPNLPKEDWYGDITLDQIATVMNSLDYEKDTLLCKTIQYIAIALGDPELLYEMVVKVDWADVEKLSESIIESKDVECNYYLLEHEIEGLDIKRHAQVIIDSCDPEYNYLLASLVQELDLDIDIIQIGKSVIASKDLYYNYLFAYEIDGADIEGHGRVIIESKDPYYNNLFATEITGADIDAHRNASMNNTTGKKKILIPIDKNENN